MPSRILSAIAVTELDARQTLGARVQQLWQEPHAQMDTLKTPERDLIPGRIHIPADHEDARLGVDFFDPFEQLDAVELRHGDVRDHQREIGGVLLIHFQALLAVRSQKHIEMSALQMAFDDMNQSR